MGLLYVKVDGQWLPLATSNPVAPPAYAGPNSAGPTEANFGNLAQPHNIGFNAGPTGYNAIVNAVGMPLYIYQSATYIGQFDVNGLTATPAEVGPRYGYPTWARFGSTNDPSGNNTCGFIVQPDGQMEANHVAGKRFYVYDHGVGITFSSGENHNTSPGCKCMRWYLGNYTPHANAPCIWIDSGNAAAENYTLLAHSSGTFLNGWGGTGNLVGLRIANQSRVNCDAGGTNINGRLTGNYQIRGEFETSQVWDTWQHLSMSAPGGQAFMGCHGNGTGAAALRIYPGQGDSMYAVNWNNTAHTALGGSAWVTMSSATLKRDMRPLRPQREHIFVYRDPGSDVVEQPDIMALQPTVFRWKSRIARPVQIEEPTPENHNGEWIGEDYPDDNWIQRDQTRERLGLIAEDVDAVIPSAVIHDEDGKALGIDYAQITVALLDHVQRLTDEVATLRYRIAELEGAQA